jgi:hypothetical protein
MRAQFEGEITKAYGFFHWTSGPNDGSIKIGKMKLSVSPSQFGAWLDSE